MYYKRYDNKEPSHFPLEYFIDFLKFLRKNEATIKILTYDDLPWGRDYDYGNYYPDELNNWREQLRDGTRDNRKIYVLIQHDVDSVAERTMTILREEERLGIPSNVMIFNRRINRWRLQDNGELIYTDYKLDYGYLRRLQEKLGFVIGYHSNAYGQALFNRGKALAIFEEDVKSLRKYFNIRYFSPHGGARSPEGFSNNILQIPDSLKYSLRWVQNRQTVSFDSQYSDGGLNSPQRDPARRDLRDFVRTWKPGKRYRVLIHPEYYHTPCIPSPRMTGTKWYDDLLLFYKSEKKRSVWDDIVLGASWNVFDYGSRFKMSLKNFIRKCHAR